ncbi:MAG: transcription elongation factor GreA [Gammaproteobacteria bacterium]|nr:MAG: transcription elongation factor GreA [Gammaproteobacteria bacterium]
MSRMPITGAGVQRLRDELNNLKTKERRAISQALLEARAHGDIRENAEFHAAKEKQSFVEGRIAAIESSLANAQIIEPASLNAQGKVVFGATVELVNVETDEEVRYQIVGDLETDVKAGRISISSPIARALIGKEEGDTVTVMAPGGESEYEILSVAYV